MQMLETFKKKDTGSVQNITATAPVKDKKKSLVPAVIKGSPGLQEE